MLLSAVAGAQSRDVVIDDFENGLSPHWEEKVFAGPTEYRVVPDAEGHCLQARSENSASGLIYRKEYSLQEYPVLSWRWKIDNVLSRGDARKKSGDDYPARVYVVFPHWIPFKTRSINYIWANRLPAGAFVPNPFFSGAVMLAVESGEAKAGRWVGERRNVRDDYRMIFGEEPGEVGALAIMTDTDNTGQKTRAFYDDLRICTEN